MSHGKSRFPRVFFVAHPFTHPSDPSVDPTTCALLPSSGGVLWLLVRLRDDFITPRTLTTRWNNCIQLVEILQIHIAPMIFQSQIIHYKKDHQWTPFPSRIQDALTKMMNPGSGKISRNAPKRSVFSREQRFGKGTTLQETNISHLGKRKIIFKYKYTLGGDMLVS